MCENVRSKQMRPHFLAGAANLSTSVGTLERCLCGKNRHLQFKVHPLFTGPKCISLMRTFFFQLKTP